MAREGSSLSGWSNMGPRMKGAISVTLALLPSISQRWHALRQYACGRGRPVHVGRPGAVAVTSTQAGAGLFPAKRRRR
jgi:hypothetical protein